MIATALLSHFFLKKRLKKYEILGCTITLLGICVASVSGYVFPDPNGKSNVSFWFKNILGLQCNVHGGLDSCDSVCVPKWFIICI